MTSSNHGVANFGVYPQQMTSVNGTLYFTANDGVDGVELWKSDGTAAGTNLVKDLNPGSSSSNPLSLTNVNDTSGTPAAEAHPSVFGANRHQAQNLREELSRAVYVLFP